MKKVMVTGASGFIGTHLVLELVKQGVEVFGIVRENSTTASRIQGLKNVHVIACNLEDLDRLKEDLKEEKIDVCYHLGWEGASGPLRTDEKTQLKNVMYGCQAVQVAKSLGCHKVVATGTIYENLCEAILKEKTFKTPAFYLFCKQNAYKMMKQLCYKEGLSFAWCTFFHPIGKYIKPEQMMAYTVSSLLKGESPTFGPAQEPYDIIAVEDLVYGLYLAGKISLKEDYYYIGTGAPLKLEDYLLKTQALINDKVSLGIGKRADDGLRFSWEWMKVDLFRKETGFQTKVSFEEAIQQLVEWVR